MNRRAAGVAMKSWARRSRVPIDRTSSMRWEAEPEICDEATVEGEEEVWPALSRNPRSPARPAMGWNPKG